MGLAAFPGMGTTLPGDALHDARQHTSVEGGKQDATEGQTNPGFLCHRGPNHRGRGYHLVVFRSDLRSHFARQPASWDSLPARAHPYWIPVLAAAWFSEQRFLVSVG